MKYLFRTIFVFVLVVLSISVEAAVVHVIATGEYSMGDNDTRREAKQFALASARRQAAEMAGVQVESYTTVKNGQVVLDEAKTEVSVWMKDKVQPKFEWVGQWCVKATVNVEVNTGKLKKLALINRKQNEQQNHEVENLRNKQERLENEIESLKIALKSTKNVEEKKAIKKKLAKGEQESAEMEEIMKNMFLMIMKNAMKQ